MAKKTDSEDIELRKAVTRAFNKVVKSLEKQPSSILVIGDADDDADDTIDDITSWLFRRRKDDGDTGD